MTIYTNGLGATALLLKSVSYLQMTLKFKARLIRSMMLMCFTTEIGYRN